MVFSQTHAWIFTKSATVGNYTHCCMSSNSDCQRRLNIKVADNNLPIIGAGKHSKE